MLIILILYVKCHYILESLINPEARSKYIFAPAFKDISAWTKTQEKLSKSFVLPMTIIVSSVTIRLLDYMTRFTYEHMWRGRT